MSTKPLSSLMAFDYGLRWIGVAVGQTLTGTASPLQVLKANDGIPHWPDIEKLLKEWQPDAIVVGLPLNMDDSEFELTHRARKFANRIHGRFGLPVFMMDERLSSVEARNAIIAEGGGINFKAQNVDSRSAALILESWMQSQPVRP